MTHRLPLIAAACLLLVALPLGAQQVVLDINTGAPSNRDSAPNSLSGIPNGAPRAFFAASTTAFGREPWMTDGTTAGTVSLGDLDSGINGSNPTGFCELSSGDVVFSATGPNGREPWVTDGTQAGTQFLLDVHPGPNPGVVTDFVAFGGDAYFFADDSVTGIELWKTDGTTAGTQLVHEFVPGSGGAGTLLYRPKMVVVGAQLFLFAKDPVLAGFGLYVSDGTSAGTQHVASLTDSLAKEVGDTCVFGSQLVFSAEDVALGLEPWISDGTSAGTMVLDVVSGGSSLPLDFFEFAGHVYFAAFRVDVGCELFRTDGTQAGTELFIDIRPGAIPLFNGSEPDMLGVVNGYLIVSALPDNGARRLYRTDGTVAGSSMISSAPTMGILRKDDRGVVVGGSLYFQGNGSSVPDELWRTDGTTAGTFRVSDLASGPALAGVEEVTAIGGDLLMFVGDDGVVGAEPWISDGSMAGTVLLDDVAEPFATLNSDPAWLVRVGDRVFFSADDGVIGDALWVTGGNAADTQLVFDPSPGDPAISVLPGVPLGDRLLFYADDGVNGLEPWITDGTALGTSMLADLWSGPVSSNWGFPESVQIDDKVYFTAFDDVHGPEIFVTDGTPAGTGIAFETVVGPNSGLPQNLCVVDDKLWFVQRDPGFEAEYWVYDPATDVLGQLADMNPGGNDAMIPATYGVVPQGVVFAAADGVHGFEPWIDPAGPAPPQMIADLYPGPGGSRPDKFVAFGDLVLFVIEDGAAEDLWVTDGTAAGTQQLADNQGILRSDWLITDDRAFIWAIDVVGQDSLYVTDGTVAGTEILLSTTYQSSFATKLYQAGSGSRVVFQNFTPETGIETWVSDGTVAGTVPVSDAMPGVLSSQPREFLRLNDALLHTAYLPGVGRELISLPLVDVDGWVAEPIGVGCEGASGLTARLETNGAVSSSTPFSLDIKGAPANSTCFLHHALNRWNVQFQGCWIYPALTIQPFPVALDLNGEGSLPLNLPPGTLGLQIFVQGFVTDPGSQLAGLFSATRGLEWVVGP